MIEKYSRLGDIIIQGDIITQGDIIIQGDIINQGDIIIQGDFNVYANTDFVEFDNDISVIIKRVNLDDSDYHSDTIMSRNNLDHKHTNNSGKLLVNKFL